MPVHQPCRRSAPLAPPHRLAAAQMAVHDLRAGSSIVAVEGALQLDFRDHSLAWLGDAVPLTSLTLHEGECFVTPQRGVVSISAMQANAAVFIVLPSRRRITTPAGAHPSAPRIIWPASSEHACGAHA